MAAANIIMPSMADQTTPRAARKTKLEWEKYRPLIVSYYRKMTLEDVMSVMKEQHGFHATYDLGLSSMVFALTGTGNVSTSSDWAKSGTKRNTARQRAQERNGQALQACSMRTASLVPLPRDVGRPTLR